MSIATAEPLGEEASSGRGPSCKAACAAIETVWTNPG